VWGLHGRACVCECVDDVRVSVGGVCGVCMCARVFVSALSVYVCVCVVWCECECVPV
jgi:hypothetical protein